MRLTGTGNSAGYGRPFTAEPLFSGDDAAYCSLWNLACSSRVWCSHETGRAGSPGWSQRLTIPRAVTPESVPVVSRQALSPNEVRIVVRSSRFNTCTMRLQSCCGALVRLRVSRVVLRLHTGKDEHSASSTSHRPIMKSDVSCPSCAVCAVSKFIFRVASLIAAQERIGAGFIQSGSLHPGLANDSKLPLSMPSLSPNHPLPLRQPHVPP
jgi:hypothetical protein